MRSKLKMFYSRKDEINLLEEKSHLIFSNPFYQVGNFLKRKNFYIENYKNNLEDLKIEKGCSYYTSMYDEKTNTIYSDNYISDIFGLLHVASNHREKEGLGLINENGEGIGLNNGLTSFLAGKIIKENQFYSIEKIIAKTLYLIDEYIITNAYFLNDQILLKMYNIDISNLNNCLDEYHNNSLKIKELSDKKTDLRFKIVRNDKLIHEIEDLIYELKNRNETLVYELFKIISDLIAYSNIETSNKIKIIGIINNELNNAYNIQGMNYLKIYEDDFRYIAYSKTSKVKGLSK